MAYGNMGGYWGTHGKSHEEAGRDRSMAPPVVGRTPDPRMVAERQRMENMMADMAHVTPTGDLVTYAPEPFGDRIRMLSKELGGAIDPAAVEHNRKLQLGALNLAAEQLRPRPAP